MQSPAKEVSDWAESAVKPEWDDALENRRRALKRTQPPPAYRPPGPKRQRTALVERKERTIENGVYSVARDDLYCKGGDAVIHALDPGRDVNELPEFLDIMVSENEDGTGSILCLTEPLDEVELTEAERAYGFLLCLVRTVGVLQL